MAAAGKYRLSGTAKALLCIAPFICCREYILSVHCVKGDSMQPALNGSIGVNDWVAVDKLSLAWAPLRRGEVVALRAPDDCDELLLKRVVGLEGDIVRDRDNIARRVPTGHCWVEGDNGPRSTRDSNKLGPVAVGLVTGRAGHIVWPPNHMGRIPSVVPPQHRYSRKAAKHKDA